MFIFKLGLYSYAISLIDGEFVVKCEQDKGRNSEDGIKATAESAYFAAQKQSRYMPSAGMIEYYTAQEMGVSIEPSGLKAEEGLIY